MIENYRTQRVWQLYMRNSEVQLGLQRAGFVPLTFKLPGIQFVSEQNAINLSWDASAGRTYQVEYSPDLKSWFTAPTGEIVSTGPTATWIDNGPPGTPSSPMTVSQRFYRVFQFGTQ